MILSIVVPILNEFRLIDKALTKLRAVLPEDESWEVIVVDGGSHDATVDKARAHCATYAWRFVERKLSDPSVGKTVVEGVRQASGKSVLVLPIDVEISAAGLRSWRKRIEANAQATGGFRKRYTPANSILKISAFLQNEIRSKCLRDLVWTNACFFPPDTEIPTSGFLEDVMLSDRLRRRSTWHLLPESVLVSSRRYYPRRSLFRTLLNISIVTCYRLRLASPEKLKYLYYRLK